jgi:hypothetical protein
MIDEKTVRNIVEKLEIFTDPDLPYKWLICDNCFEKGTNTCYKCSKKFIYANLYLVYRIVNYGEHTCQKCRFKEQYINDYDELDCEHYYVEPDLDANYFEQAKWYQ